MKVKITAAVMLILSVTVIIIGSAVASGAVKDIEGRVREAELSGNAEEIEKIYEDYRNDAKFLSLSVRRGEMADIEDSFVNVISLARHGLTDEANVEKDRLCALLLRLRRSLGFDASEII